MEDFVIYSEIGRGSVSVVYKGRKTATLEYVAVQSVEKAHEPEARAKFELAQRLQHPNVLSVFKYCATPTQHWLVMEYCPGGDLAALLALDKALPPFSVWQFALDLAAGLQHCHARGVVVGDLRPSRVLVANGWLKIGSLSRGLFAPQPVIAPSVLTTPRLSDAQKPFAAPELQSDGLAAASVASDKWALGCVLYALATGGPPPLLTQQQDAPSEQALGQLPPDLAAVVAALLCRDPCQRASWAALGALPYWRDQLLFEPPVVAVEEASLLESTTRSVKHLIRPDIVMPSAGPYTEDLEVDFAFEDNDQADDDDDENTLCADEEISFEETASPSPPPPPPVSQTDILVVHKETARPPTIGSDKLGATFTKPTANELATEDLGATRVITRKPAPPTDMHVGQTKNQPKAPSSRIPSGLPRPVKPHSAESSASQSDAPAVSELEATHVVHKPSNAVEPQTKPTFPHHLPRRPDSVNAAAEDPTHPGNGVRRPPQTAPASRQQEQPTRTGIAAAAPMTSSPPPSPPPARTIRTAGNAALTQSPSARDAIDDSMVSSSHAAFGDQADNDDTMAITALLDHLSDRAIAPLVGNARIERLVLPFAAGQGCRGLGLPPSVSWEDVTGASVAATVKALHATIALALDETRVCF